LGCIGTIAAGASCTVTVTPTSVGAQSSAFKVVDSAFDQQVVQVDWNAVSGSAFLTDGLVNNQLFQVAGTSVTVTAVVRNGGTDVLNIGQAFLTNSPPAAISNDTCSNQSLAVGAACVFLVTATPTALGNWATTITVPSDAAVGPNPATQPISGFAYPPDPAQPVFLPASVSFSARAVGAVESTRVVWVDNGLVAAAFAQPLAISSVSIGGADAPAFRVVWDGCTGLTLDAVYSCPVEVGFDPTAGRTFNASLLYTDNAGGSPQAVPLSGTGLAGASALPASVDFRDVIVNTKSKPVTVTLTNHENIPVGVGRVLLSGADKGDFTITSENCKNQTLKPGASCQVVIVFRPQSVGIRSAALTFNDTAANTPQSVALTGTGVNR
jgi:hypothetical protein